MPWDTKDFCEQIVRDASPQELTKLMDEVQNQPSAPLRSRLLKAVIETIDPAGLPSALQRLEAPPGPDQATAAAILAHLRSQADSTVLGFLSRNSKAPWLEGAVLEAMQHAAKRSSSEAWATIELLTDRKLVALAREAVLTTEAKTQPLTACNRLLALPRSSPRGQLAGAILSEWSRTSPEAAVTWLNANLSGPEKHKATSDMLLRLGGSVPAPLWPLIDELPSESLRRTALRYSQPELPASIAPPEAFQRAAEWKSEGREGAALSHYLAALSATDFNNAWAVVNSADYPSEHRITHMAQLLVDKQSSLDNIANVITEQAGEHAPAVALRILAENRPKLRVQQLAELEAMAGLVKHDSR